MLSRSKYIYTGPRFALMQLWWPIPLKAGMMRLVLVRWVVVSAVLSVSKVPAAWKSHGKWFLFSRPGIFMDFVKK